MILPFQVIRTHSTLPCRRLLQEHYPWFLRTYDALPKPIMRADAIRPFYMHHHGERTICGFSLVVSRCTDCMMQCRKPIMCADAIRPFYMHRHGKAVLCRNQTFPQRY